MSWRSWLQEAFAVEMPKTPPTEAEQQLLQRLSREIVRRGLGTPALIALEMSLPLNYLGAQAMQFFEPIVASLTDAREYALFARFLERRDALDLFATAIQQQLAGTSGANSSDEHPKSSPGTGNSETSS